MTILGNLPDGVVYEILLRLPVKSIRRFKCVCKDWYKVIESIRFREDHYALQSNSALLLPDPYRFEYPGRDLRWKILSGATLTIVKDLDVPPPMRLWFHMICHCRGSFLIYHRIENRTRMNLWNPSTRAFLCLPYIPWMDSGPKFPLIELCVYGLGWDPSTGGYKVVCLLCSSNAAVVYTPGTSNSWRFVNTCVPKIPPQTHLGWHPDYCLYANGFCYWQSMYGYLRDVCNENFWMIVSFDVAREVFATFALPPVAADVRPGDTALSSYHDSLACLAVGSRCHVEVWVLEQQQLQPSWTKVFDINVGNFCQDILHYGIWNDTHVFVLGKGDPRKLLLCDMNGNHVEERDMDGNIDTAFLNYKISLFNFLIN